MHKRILRSISALLVIIMVAELLPTTLLGNLVMRANAAEYSDTANTFDYSIPQETDNTAVSNLPATIIDVTVPQTETAEQTSDEESSLGDENVELPDITIHETTEEDLRFISLVRNYSQYSSLPAEDAVFLCAYTEVASESFTELETAGVSLIPSVNYARLAAEYGCALSRIVALSPTEEVRQNLLEQITIYKSLLRDELIGTVLDLELREYLLQGHSCEQVFNAYGVSETFGIPMEDLLEEDDDQPMPATLSEVEIQKIQAFSDTLNVAAVPVASHAAENDLTAAEIESHQEEIDCKRSELMVAPQGSGNETSSGETETAQDVYLGAPFTYNSSDSEKVALNTGALIYENADYVLPGVNGLDIVIGTRYNSQDASIYLPDEKTEYCTAYRVTYRLRAWWEVPGLFPWDDQNLSDSAVFYSRAEANSFAEAWRALSYSTAHEDGSVYHVECTANISTVCVPNGYSSSIKPNNYANQLYGLGHGWSLQFSSIETIESKKYLHLSNGSTYEIDWYSNGSHLKDYLLKDLVMERNCTEFTNGSTTSKYRLTYQDGRREYFSNDGKLIGIQDRYGNCITFVHSTQNGYPYIAITDTLGREIVISGQDSADGHTMTVSLPDGLSLTYRVVHDENAQALASCSDTEGNTTHFSYTKQSAGFDITAKLTNDATNVYLNLTTVTHPTGAQSIYAYATANRNLGKDGLMQVYRISSRMDKSATEEINQQTYAYSANDCSGYPAQRNPENLPSNFNYSTSVTDASGMTITATFNHKHLQTKAEAANNNGLLQTVEYIYNNNKIPVQETVCTYSQNNQASPLAVITATEYDEKGNVTASWSTQANGDTSNTEYKTAYTYDSTYGLLLTKTWKTDADTTVQVQNTLDSAKKTVTRTEVYENNVLKARTDYTYDSYGNLTSEKQYHDGFILEPNKTI